MLGRQRVGAAGIALAGCVLAVDLWSLPHTIIAQTEPIPRFELDRTWPKPLPNNWAFGDAWGIATDPRDHVWVFHARSEESREWIEKEAKQQAPPVVEFDADGNFVQAWGGPGPGYTWMENPIAEHGIWVDAANNVWVTGNGHVALKFTQTGKFVESR
jgi:hypothetical protein